VDWDEPCPETAVRPHPKGMYFDYECGWCGADCSVWGEEYGFWTSKYRVPAFWDCWSCGEENETPDD
jgi:hypothetical protein